METDQAFLRYREHEGRFQRRLAEIRAETDATLREIGSRTPDAADAAHLTVLRAELEGPFQENLNHTGAVIDSVLTLEEANRRATAMTEKSPGPQRGQAQIQELSEELSKSLRLDRIDSAIKEFLEFLADTDFLRQTLQQGAVAASARCRML